MGIFYVKHALGIDYRPLKVYKIRTMIPKADELYDGLLITNGLDQFGRIRDDPRITNIGRILRTYCLDEVPQILTNFAIGNMKLVGIRPRSEKSWNSYPEGHKQRALKQRPGLFGVNHLSKKGSFSDLMRLEEQYLDEYEKNPFMTDMKYFFNIVFENFIKR
jgi:lipopolysaccharide/colanic/teichoic acid biosynthesis glycosyltransferase